MDGRGRRGRGRLRSAIVVVLVGLLHAHSLKGSLERLGHFFGLKAGHVHQTAATNPAAPGGDAEPQKDGSQRRHLSLGLVIRVAIALRDKASEGLALAPRCDPWPIRAAVGGSFQHRARAFHGIGRRLQLLALARVALAAFVFLGAGRSAVALIGTRDFAQALDDAGLLRQLGAFRELVQGEIGEYGGADADHAEAGDQASNKTTAIIIVSHLK